MISPLAVPCPPPKGWWNSLRSTLPPPPRTASLWSRCRTRPRHWTRILVQVTLKGMAWEVTLQESVVKDLRWFGRKVGRLLLAEAEALLSADPLAETRNLKTLRPNAVAQRELRLQGKYRVLFNVDEEVQAVTIVLVGEKQGNRLIVQGEEFTAHH